MRRRLLLAGAFAVTAMSMQAAVGDDLTGKYLKNADFSMDTPLQQGVTTYAKDAAGAGTTLSGMQLVAYWAASNPYEEGGTDVDARAAGVFELGKQFVGDYTGNDDDYMTPIFLGGTTFQTPAPTEGQSEGHVLGMVAVWGANLQYTQIVTLPAGTYEIEMPVYNSGGEVSVDTNLFGFVADNGTTYCATELAWPVGAWTTMKAAFTLTEATTGVISVGYKAANSGSSSMPHLYLAGVKVLEGDATAVDIEKANQLKETLLAYIEEGESLGADTQAAQAVYDNPTASYAEVEAAIEAQKQINANSQVDLSEFFIQNPHFNQDDALEGGITTYDYDRSTRSVNYYGMQPVKSWTANFPALTIEENPLDVNKDSDKGGNYGNGYACGVIAIGSGAWIGGETYTVPGIMSDGSKEGNVLGFVTCWSRVAQYTQAVTIPAGKYTLTISYYNTGGTNEIAENLMGFIADDGTKYLADTKTFKIGSWEKMRVSFELDEATSGVFSVGYASANSGSATMPHFFIDGISLNYVGETQFDPSLFALQAAVSGGQNKLDYTFNNDLKNQLEEVVNAGDALVKSQSADKDANIAATEAINALMIEVNECIDAYVKMDEFINVTLTEVIAKYDSSEELADFAGELADDKDVYANALENGEYTTAQINDIINGFGAREMGAVQVAFEKAAADGAEHTLDITCLFADKNLGYANSTVEGWKNETGTTAFLSRVQTAEVWNQESFNVYQTLENLPAGVYELQVPGFYRSADNVTNYDEFQNESVVGTAYIYVGGNKQLMHNVAELVSADNSYRSGVIEDGAMYVPNTNNDAHYFFYDQEELNVQNTVKGVLAETGTLTVGVKGQNLEGNAWVVWGGLNIVYKGTVGMESALYAELQSKCEDANALSEQATAVEEADDMLNTALAVAGDCTEASDVETLKGAIKQVDEAVAYVNESADLIAALQNKYAIYNEYLMGTVDSDEPNYTTLLDEVATALDDSFESNAQIEKYIARLSDEWATFVQYPVLKTASEQEPGDITAAILNNGFEGIMNSQAEQSGAGDAEYWNVENEGGSFGYQFGIYENYNSTTFNISQTIKGLAPGYYRVKVQGFYRSGANQENADAVAGDTANVVTLYANEASVLLNNQLQNGTNGAMIGVGDEPAITVGDNAEYYVPNNREALAAIFESEEPYYWNQVDAQVGEDGTLTIGLKKEAHVETDWCPFDNFQLFYLGAAAPTAVETIEAAPVAAHKAVYDLSGRRVSKAIKGIYVVDGKKVVK